MNLVVFDFDGTLTKSDTLKHFLLFYAGKRTFVLNLLKFSPSFLLYKLGILKNDIAKERLIKLFFLNASEENFKKKAKEFALNHIDKILNKKIYKKLQSHKKDGDEVIVISASLQCWIKPWCDKENIKYISTKLEFLEKRITGKFATKNCYGMEKVNRLKNYTDISKYDKIISYGDSAGDLELFKISHEFYKV